jgi:hypothetical protein
MEHYKKILKDTEKRALFVIKNQILDRNSQNYGGILTEGGLVQAKSTIFAADTLISLYHNKDSKYYKDEKIYERIVIALEYIKRQHREDGTFDFINCNFYAAPDTAFCLNGLLPSYKLLSTINEDESIKLKNGIYEILNKAAYGIMKGGFHTPNHRWAIASVLMACYNIIKDEEMKKVAMEYLSEGIDCNEYGEYAERSAGGYNAVNNDAMILLAEETGDERFLEYVNRNLNMMFTYIEPDGSIFTNNSTRQDNGKKVYPIGYYFEYLYMAYKTKDKDFSAAANKIMEALIERGHMAPDCLSRLMINPELIEYQLSGNGFPDNYKQYYKESGIVRVRKGDVSYSLLENSGRFLYFQAGALNVYMRIGVTYFDQREFKIQKLLEIENGYELHYKAKGWYYKVFKDKPETSDWWKMDHTKREKISGPDLDFTVIINEIESGIAVNVKTDGCDRVPVKLEVCFSAGSSISSESFMCEGVAGGSIVAASGNIKVNKGMDSIEVGPAFGKHNFVGGYAGSETSSRDHFTIYFTDYTNFDHTITFRKG